MRKRFAPCLFQRGKRKDLGIESVGIGWARDIAGVVAVAPAEALHYQVDHLWIQEGTVGRDSHYGIRTEA